MAVSLKDALKSNNNEPGSLLSVMADAEKSGNINRAAKGGFAQDALDWYYAQTKGKTQEQINADISSKRSAEAAQTNKLVVSGQLNEQGLTPEEVAKNKVADAEYQKRLDLVDPNRNKVYQAGEIMPARNPDGSLATGAGGGISQQDYQIKPGESLYDYNRRIATARGQTTFSVPNVSDKDATSVTYNLQEEIAKINKEANANQQGEYTTLTTDYDSKVDLSSSAKLAERLVGMLEDNRTDKAPSLVEEFNKQRQALGVGALENELAGLDAEIARLDADYTSTLSEEEARPVSLGMVRKRQGAVELAYNRQRRDLQVQRQYAADRLDTKMGIVSTIVSLTNTDYQNATSKYDSDFSKAIQITNLVRGIEEDQKADEEKRIDNARANVQVMYNLIKEGNVSYDSLSQSEKANIAKMETQAGLPSGFVKYISETIEDPAVSFLSAYTDASGKRIQPIATTDPKTGAVKINNISLGRAKAEDGDGPNEKIITQATLNKLGAAGVPEVVAIDIQRSLNSGKNESIIRAHLKEQLGAVTAQKYMDAFNSVMKSAGSGLVEIP